MRRLRPLLALALLPLWFAASVHCGLEVLREAVAHGTCSGNLCNDKQDCSRDSCDLLEGSGYRSEMERFLLIPAAVAQVPLAPPAELAPDAPAPGLAAVLKPPVLYHPPPLRPVVLVRRAAAWTGAPATAAA
jgi:hypothetical protein